MKKMLFITCLLSIALTLTSQAQNENCKYSTNKVDKFTGHKNMLTKSQIIINGMSKVKFSLFRQDSLTGLYIEYTGAKKLYFTGSNDKLYLRFENEKVMTFNLLNDYTLREKIQGYNYFKLFYPISKSEFEQLTKVGLNSFRIEINKNIIDFDVKKDKAKNYFINNWNCIF